MITWDTDPEFLRGKKLVDECLLTTGEPGDARADALIAEIERRGLDL